MPAAMTAESTGRFVKTAAIRQAVGGHEVEILNKLGVEWPGKGHVHCPYPDHPDKDPSWRWDERKKRAFCTCLVDPRSSSIFDFAAKVLGLDFDAVKLRIAELLDRSDLIIEKRNGDAEKTDPQSLLNPAAAIATTTLFFATSATGSVSIRTRSRGRQLNRWSQIARLFRCAAKTECKAAACR